MSTAEQEARLGELSSNFNLLAPTAVIDFDDPDWKELQLLKSCLGYS